MTFPRALLASLGLATLALFPVAKSQAQPALAPTYGEELQGFEMPYPLQHYRFTSQGNALQMGYLDVPADASKDQGRVAVLMHGKNFCAATWQQSIDVLSHAGYRVIAPDQIGFCTSSKPAFYQYTFQQLATNTHNLLKSLGLDHGDVTVIGHSTGGMLATRYALLYPNDVQRLVLVDPIGLEDWKAIGVPYRTVDDWYQRELGLTADSVRAYEKSTYYADQWKPDYERWVTMLAGLNAGLGHQRVAWNSALIYDMIFTQPVYYEFKNLQPPTLLMIGDADTTAIGSDIAPPEVKAKIGHYPQLGKDVAKLIPRSTLIEWPGLGHAPQIQDPELFHHDLMQWLSTH